MNKALGRWTVSPRVALLQISACNESCLMQWVDLRSAWTAQMFILIRVDPLQRDALGSFCHTSLRLLLRYDLDRLERQELVPLL